MRNEGVIKFDLQFTAAAPGPGPGLDELTAWRRILRQLGLIGQDPARYGGCGFGNISRRLPPYEAPANHRAFVISGSQTGHLEELSSAGFATVREYDAERNRVAATGPVKPSSESLTHGAVYNAGTDIRVIFHVHSPAIWRCAARLELPVTGIQFAYGTPAMAREIGRLIEAAGLMEAGVVAMGGHEDGVIAFGHTADQAGSVLMRALAHGYACRDATKIRGPGRTRT
jgi:ribulose-5-phosphate 4-epimerase/fuculose-1-phosphate aldolase